jgi:hypothetical protein
MPLTSCARNDLQAPENLLVSGWIALRGHSFGYVAERLTNSVIEVGITWHARSNSRQISISLIDLRKDLYANASSKYFHLEYA